MSIRTIVGADLIGAVVIACFTVALFAGPALAVNECERPGFAALFDRRFTGCEEVTRIPLRWRSGVSEVVVLRTSGISDLARSNGVVGLLRETVSRMGAALDQMGGDFEVDLIYVMLTEERSAVNGADAYAIPGDPSFPHACPVMVFIGPTGSGSSYVTFVMAHELFHCVQGSTWAAGMALTDNDWWAEGSAEFFANLTFPGQTYSEGYVASFATRSDTDALTSLDYENVVFFSWLSQRRGARSVRAFIQAVSGTSGGEAGRAAAESALSPEEWLDFAKTYVAGEVELPGGVGVAPPPDIPEQSAETPLELIGSPLVLVRARMTYEAGEYDNRVETESGTYAARSGSDWATIPEHLNIECSDEKQFLFAAMSAGTGGTEITVTATQTEERTCVPCGEARATPVRNSCIIGRWTYDGPPAFCSTFAARLAAADARVVSCNAGTGEITFAPNGTLTQSSVGQDIVVEMTAGLTLHINQSLESRANWATGGGELQLCEVSGAITGTRTMSGGGSTVTKPINSPFGPETGVASFRCTPTTLTITMHEAPGAYIGVGPETVMHRASP